MPKAQVIVLRNWHVSSNALKTSLDISPTLKLIDLTMN